jgi:hypothetical protein
MGRIRFGFLLLIVNLYFISCEKKEQPIALPPQGDAVMETLQMGSDYHDQIFYDLATKSVVFKSPFASWDIAFESGATQHHIFINGGKGMVAYNTHVTDITKVTTLPTIKNTEWVADKSCGKADSSAIGEWTTGPNRISKGEVYIIKINPAYFPDTFKKIVVAAVTNTEYVLMYSNLRDNNIKQITIPKDENYNFSYFAFEQDNKGSLPHPEPPKNTWDIVFTRYHYMYYKPVVMPYPVTGVLSNPYKTSAFMDSTKAFESIDHTIISPEKFSNDRDVVGSWWKEYNVDKGVWTVSPKRVYIIKTRNNEYYKLHFLSFLDDKGLSGAPKFEFKRIL